MTPRDAIIRQSYHTKGCECLIITDKAGRMTCVKHLRAKWLLRDERSFLSNDIPIFKLRTKLREKYGIS